MTRFAIASLVAFVTLIVAHAPDAHAGTRPTRISGQFGVQELYPKTIKRYNKYRSNEVKLRRAYDAAMRRGDEHTVARIRKLYAENESKMMKALKKLRSVRGVTTVVVWGDAGDRMPRSKIAKFLRKKRDWQGRTVHFYARDGKLKYSGRVPRTYDGKKRKARPTPKPTPSVLPGGFIPQTKPLPGSSGSGGAGGGIFGLG